LKPQFAHTLLLRGCGTPHFGQGVFSTGNCAPHFLQDVFDGILKVPQFMHLVGLVALGGLKHINIHSFQNKFDTLCTVGYTAA